MLRRVVVSAVAAAGLFVGGPVSHADQRSSGLLRGQVGAVRPCVPVSAQASASAGVTTHSYTSAAGQFRVVVPATGFRPLTATAAQLAANGLPPRPRTAALVGLWERMVTHWNVAPGTPCVEAVTNGATGGSANSTNPSWAGEMSADTHLLPYTNTVGLWYQTGFKETCGNYYEGSSTWMGIGGWNSTNLAQAGVTTPIEVAVSNPAHAFYQQWSSSNPYAYATQLPMVVNPGDQVYTNVTTDGHGHNQYFVYDLTTSQSTGTIYTSNFWPYEGSVEAIDEAPSFNMGGQHYQAVLHHWANGNILHIGNYANTLTTVTPVGAFVHYNMFMNVANSPTEAAGANHGMLNNTDFYNFWYNCQ